MKKLTLLALILLTCTAAYSARIGGIVVIKDPDPDPFGSYSGVARKYISGTQWDGSTGYYWQYYHYTRTTMQYCQNEQNVMIANGAQIVEYCHAD